MIAQPIPTAVKRSAVFSPCRTWRYTLERNWSDDPFVLFILLNPSTADEIHDDPTNRRGIGFARRWGFGGCVFVNLFAFRTPRPEDLKRAAHPVGPDNDRHVLSMAKSAGQIIAAWGVHGGYRKRDRNINRLLCDFDLWCLGYTKSNYPKHILYLPGNEPRVPYSGLAEDVKGHD